MTSRRCRGLAILPALAWIGSAIAGASELPPENQCPTYAGATGSGTPQVRPALIREGMVLAQADMLRLASLLPAEVWRHRQAFFGEGMRMEVGPCHRRYPQPHFYRLATEQFAGQAHLDADGSLAGYSAGLPFPPETIEPEASDAGGELGV